MYQLIKHHPTRETWNKGKLVGQKLPLKLQEVWAIRTRLQLGNQYRDLALFNLAIDSNLRACDLLKIRVSDVSNGGRVSSRAMVLQRKTKRPVQFEIMPRTRRSLAEWISLAGLGGNQYLFPSRLRGSYGLSMLTFDHNGTEREYYLYIPASYDGSDAVPLLFDFHGLNGTSESEFNRSRFDRIADREGFILVTPQGLNRRWQLTTQDSPQPFDNEDIDYMLSLLDQLTAEFNVDEERLYLAGGSQGAFFAFEIACQRSDVFAAVAAIKGGMLDTQLDVCFPSSAMPVLQIHGTEDIVVDYSHALAALDLWITVNQTNPVPIVIDIHDFDENDGSTVEYYHYGAGINMFTVEHFKVIGGGHDWPGFSGNNDINASEEAWTVFSKFDNNGLID